MSSLASTTSKPRLWQDPPRRAGLGRFVAVSVRLLGLFRDQTLTLFIDLLGAFSTPGVKLVGRLQAAALRGMGAECKSDEIWLGPGVRFDWPEHLVLGARVTLNRGTHVTCHDRVEIGDDFLAAPGLVINAGTHDLATLQPASAPIRIGPGVWCGARVTICAGVTVGAGAVLGAGAVVVRDLPPEHVCLGVPAKPVRDISRLRRETPGRWSNFLHG
mgnify:CR=1 FL=1|jgi:Acetyltransferase (isoleucine patch superfamily)